MRLVALVAVLLGLGTAPALATPDLQLFRNGGVTENTSDDIGASVAGTPRSVIYMIVNGGNTTLSLPASAVTVASSTNATCSVAVQPNVVVTAGNSTLFTVGLTPTAGGAFSCAWSIASDDPDQPFTFVTAGTASGPAGQAVLEVVNPEGRALATGDSDRFDMLIGLPRRRTYVIGNTGTVPLTLAASVQPGPNATCRLLNDPPTSLTAGARDGLVVVEVEPLTGGLATCTLALTTNDPLAAPSTIELTNQPGLELAYLGSPLPSGAEITLLFADARAVPFTVTNLDTVTIDHLSVEVTVGDCTVTKALPAELAPDAEAELIVQAPEAQDFNCVIAVRSSDFFAQAVVVRSTGGEPDPCGGNCNIGGPGGSLLVGLALLCVRTRRRRGR